MPDSYTNPRAICPECRGPLHDGPCPQTHRAQQPTTPAGGRNAGEQLAAYKAAVERALELIETSPEAFLSTTSNNLRAAAGVLHEAHDTPGAPA